MGDAGNSHPMRAVIMAGGEGTRLRPFTRNIPKPLLPVGRRPVGQIIVERLRDLGFDHATLTLEYNAELLKAFFQDGAQFGLAIDYYHEPRKMGTAGCLAHVPGLRGAGPFLVTNGDVLTDLDYAAMLAGHAASGAAMTVATRRGAVAIPYGVLKLDNAGTIASVDEKPTLDYVFNAGVYALGDEALAFVPDAPDAPPLPMTDLIQALVAAGRTVRAHPVEGLWFDLARVDDFEAANAELERVKPEWL